MKLKVQQTWTLMFSIHQDNIYYQLKIENQVYCLFYRNWRTQYFSYIYSRI